MPPRRRDSTQPLNPNRSLDCYALTNILFAPCLPVFRLQWHPHCALKVKRNIGMFYKLVFMSICGCLHTLGRLLPLTCIFLFFNQSRCPHRSFMQKRNQLRYRSTIDLGLIYRAPLYSKIKAVIIITLMTDSGEKERRPYLLTVQPHVS